ncbi:MAG TPA: BMP family ABC transporter substrate-binding protein [Methanoregulaceae archaeon]|nr:BMP family ABC transporter substrate-binding protein [Methanoregulaceae archaeon]
MKPALPLVSLLAILALMLIAAGCTQQAPAPVPVVYIVYGSEKGDLSYTDAASQGLANAERDMPVAIKEFFPRNYETLPAILNQTSVTEKPILIITVGFQYANFTRQLAQQHEDIRFLAIDQAGIGAENLRAYEITSYGDSYLAGVLAASATKSGHVGTILGMQSDVLEAFRQGYSDGARAVNASIIVDHAWVHQYSVDGFTDAEEAERIAENMYSNGTDVIYTCAGYSNMGAFRAANSTTGRFIIGTDTDQSPLGPEFVLASAVKRVDRIVYASVTDVLNGTFTGGDHRAGLKEGATGIVYNPKFASFNVSVTAWEPLALAREEKFLA